MLQMSKARIGAIGGGILALLTAVVAIPQLVENLDASQIMVIQYPSGGLTVYTEPGPKFQWFGKVTLYPRQKQYSFCSQSVKDGNGVQEVVCEIPNTGELATTGAKRLRFNDGGHATLNGSVNWEMPLDEKSIINIHKKFGSASGVETNAIGKMLDAAIYLAGPLMSSTESSGARRSELVQYINDQAENGVYVTSVKNIVEKDAAGNEVTTSVTEIQHNTNGTPKRQQGSILAAFNLKLLPLSISELKYDAVVEKQIAQRQASTTAVQLARANATKAEQDAITVEAEGKAKAALTKWTQEAINAKEIAEAEKKLKVATLAAQEAEQFKKQQILMGEGEAARKRLVMQADGALDKKLEAYKTVQGYWANAFKDFKGQMVPGVQMGGGAGSNSASNANALVDMLTAKTAKDLAVDLSNAGRGATAQ